MMGINDEEIELLIKRIEMYMGEERKILDLIAKYLEEIKSAINTDKSSILNQKIEEQQTNFKMIQENRVKVVESIRLIISKYKKFEEQIATKITIEE